MGNPYRLPRTVLPQRYDLSLTPDLETATFTGAVDIAVLVGEPTATLVLNAIELEIDDAWVTVDGDRREVVVTFDEDDKHFQDQFARHQENLAKADVIHIFVSCPPDDRPESIDRLQNDLTILMPNLRAVLNARQGDRPVAAVLTVTKVEGPSRPRTLSE